MQQLDALLKLIDDPDPEVYSIVSIAIEQMGMDVVPLLEQSWENALDESVQERIENLIESIQNQHFQNTFLHWWQQAEPSYFDLGMLLNKLILPSSNLHIFKLQFDKLKQDIWLELNTYMTPKEKLQTIVSILFSYYKVQCVGLKDTKFEDYGIAKILDNQRGNAFGIGLLILMLCEQLDITMHAINIPGHFVLKMPLFDDYFAQIIRQQDLEMNSEASFYFDAYSQGIFTQNDIDFFLNKQHFNKPHHYYCAAQTKKDVAVLQLTSLLETCKKLKMFSKRRSIQNALDQINADKG